MHKNKFFLWKNQMKLKAPKKIKNFGKEKIFLNFLYTHFQTQTKKEFHYRPLIKVIFIFFV